MARPANRKNEFERLKNILAALQDCKECIDEKPDQAKTYLKKAIYVSEMLLRTYENLNV